MQTAMFRVYGDQSCRTVAIERLVRRTEAMQRILDGFVATAGPPHYNVQEAAKCSARSLSLEWAGFDRYRPAAPPGEQHRTRLRLCPRIGGHRYEYEFPDGLSIDECDELLRNIVAEECATDWNREQLVTTTLAGLLFTEGVSLSNQVIKYACGQRCAGVVPGVWVIPAGLPTTLYTAVRDHGWTETAKWLHQIHKFFKMVSRTVEGGSAVWVPLHAPRRLCEPLICNGSSRLALGAEAAAYVGRRFELVVSADDRANWVSDREAELMAGKSNGRWRRYVTTHQEIRVGRPETSDGPPARNRRLIHKRDLRRAIRLSHAKDDGDDICKGGACPQRCWVAKTCPHRDRDCPGL